MMNMGLSRLRLAAPAALDEGLVRGRAVHAGEIWEKAAYFDTLEAAVADCALVIGTTRRRGQRRKALSLSPEELAARLKSHPGPAALVFGNERTGLEDGELKLCNLASHIPTGEAFPSLNLSHAVQIYAYALFRALSPWPPDPDGRRISLDQGRLAALVRSVTDSLGSLGFYKQRGRETQERFFRDIFSRAALTQREAQYLELIFAKTAALAAKTGGQKQRPEAGDAEGATEAAESRSP
jgi:tRNA/rRNA methyltransferase/tRNA (cytidine32/uridine32-2'-O)-methyltransferase